MTDFEIDEVRRNRHKVSEENDHDLRRIADYYRRIEQELRSEGRFRFAGEQDVGPAVETSVAASESA